MLAQIIALQPHLQALRDRCSNCSMHELCLPMGLDESELHRLDGIIKKRRRVLKNDYLYRMGDKFLNLYAIRVGHFKTVHTEAGGTEQVTGFQMAGELLGFDAISNDQHQCNSIALEDSEVCEVPFDRLEELFRDIPGLQRHFHRMMSQEITREQSVMLLLGNMRAEQRLAAFLVNLSSRYSQRGYSAHAFQLRMTREEIGSYLGLTIESISRLLTRFKKNGWLQVEHKEIKIADLPALKNLVSSAPSQPSSF